MHYGGLNPTYPFTHTNIDFTFNTNKIGCICSPCSPFASLHPACNCPTLQRSLRSTPDMQGLRKARSGSTGPEVVTRHGKEVLTASRPEEVLTAAKGAARVSGPRGVVHVCPLPLPPWRRQCCVDLALLALAVSTMHCICSV